MELSPQVLKRFNIKIDSISIFCLIIWYLYLAHWTACWFYFARNILFPNINFELYSHISCYIYIFHQSMLLLTMTRFTASATDEFYNLINCILICIANAGLIYCFAYIIKSSCKSNSAKKKYQEVTRQLTEYMTQLQLPQTLQNRIKIYYEYHFRNTYFQEHQILNKVSGTLRQEIVLHNCRQLVEKVPFFKDLPLSLLVRIVSCLCPEIYLANDVVIRANTFGDAMYFIVSGTVAVFSSYGREVCHLEDGNHFGEVSLVLENKMRIASVIAVEPCELYKLTRKHYRKAIMPYPELLELIQRIAMERFESLHVFDAQTRDYY